MPLLPGLENVQTMPFYQTLNIKPHTQLHLWKIEESVEQLTKNLILKPESQQRLKNMKSVEHQKGFLSVRQILNHLGLSDFDLTYDVLGKPMLSKGPFISISHAHGFSGIAISSQNLGLDIEAVKPKALQIASRFMDVDLHLKGLSIAEQTEKATVVWGIKESVFKIKNEKGISYPNHISELPFELSDGRATARLDFNNQTEFFPVHFIKREDYIFVCTFESE